MPITPDHVGRTYPPTAPYRVSRAKIVEFAAALGGVEGGDPNAAYTADEPVAPPTFAMVIAAQAWSALFDDAELGLALRRTMHADQQFTWQRPLREGDDVVATLVIEKVRQRGQTDMVTIRVDLTSVTGEALASATSQLVHTREEAAA